MKKFALLAVLVLVGCGDSTPKCGDKEATDLVKQVVRDNFPFTLTSAELSNIRTIDYRKDIDVYTCRAHFYGDIESENTGPDAPRLDRDLNYTVQLNSEKQVSVETSW